MPDFGHHLEFASFPEPKSTPPAYALDLALQSERWGYDLVAIQDHPYQGGYLDTALLPCLRALRADHLWVMEYDVDFAGRWNDLFAPFADNDADLLTKEFCQDLVPGGVMPQPTGLNDLLKLLNLDFKDPNGGNGVGGNPAFTCSTGDSSCQRSPIVACP